MWRLATVLTGCYTPGKPLTRPPDTRPYREFYLTLDVDLHGYRKPPVTLGNKLWNGLLYTVTLIHLPAPALSYQSGRGFVFYPLYF